MRELLSIAHNQEFAIDKNVSFKEAIEAMYKNKNGSIILLEEKKPVAILTESDVIKALQFHVDFNEKAYSYATKPIITALANRPVESAFDMIIQNNIRRIVLIDSSGEYAGVVLQEDLFDYLEEDVYRVDLKISDILQPNQTLISTNKESSIQDALELMYEAHIGSLLITQKSACIGILTEKDILSASCKEADMKLTVEQFMSAPVISIRENSLVVDAIERMRSGSIRRLLVVDEFGYPVGLLTNKDIFKHIKGNVAKMLEIKVRHAKETMELLPEAIVEIINVKDIFIIHWMNQVAKKLFGEELLEQAPSKLMPKKVWEELYTSLRSHKVLQSARVKIKKKVYEISGTFSKNINSSYIKLIFKDISQHEKEKEQLKNEVNAEVQKRIEQEYLLMQQSKLATTGEMIGHIAHQWRQPLSQLGGILMNIDSAYAFEELTPEYLQERLQKSNELIKYMSQTIDDFRHFFEPNRSKERFSVADYIENAINIIRASLTYHHITIEFKRPKLELLACGFPSEFAQAVLNILDNAKDILVERTVESPVITIELARKKTTLLIEISDNGGGIAKESLEKIFDLYYTNKKRPNSSGLGLYMAKLIIEQKMHGAIRAKNSNEGALFQIEIPLTKAKKEHKK